MSFNLTAAHPPLLRPSRAGADRQGARPAQNALLGLLAAFGLLSPAVAQTTPTQPLPVTVSPSGYEEPARSDARERQERLLKRMQEDEFLFRNICVQCGGGMDGPGAYAPFNPVQALTSRPAGR